MASDEQNPWKTLSSQLKYANPWFRVREDQVIRPDGKPGIYGVVETRIATGVVALTTQDEIYLVGQYRYPVNEYSWEIIEGGSEDNESAIDAAKRELRQEAGLIANCWEELGPEFHLSNCFSSEVGKAFIARDLRQVAPEPDGTEVLKIKCIPFKECLAMVEAGAIKDTLSIVAIYRANSWMQRRK